MRVAIVGAGPAGSAAAIELRRAGADVRIFEKSALPRKKTCGDGLTPSSVVELHALGVALDDRPPLAATLITAPGGAAVRGGWPAGMPPGTTMERADFDARVLAAAVAAGAQVYDKTPVTDLAALDADAVILAEGATGGLATRNGFPAFRSRLVALRGYVDTTHDAPSQYAVHYDAALTPGYAWIFPVGPRRVNVGLAVDPRVAGNAGGDVRALLRWWIRGSPHARAVIGDAPIVLEVTGGIIPSGRAKRYADGIFLVGDAAGVADPLSAEGVSQALATGRAAAHALIAANGDCGVAGAAYEAALARFDRNEREARRMRALFRLGGDLLVRRAQSRPRLADYLIETGYFLKNDASWFGGTLARAI